MSAATATMHTRDEGTDEALLTAYRAGDEQAFAVLWDRYSGRVTAYAARILKRREGGEDVCTEAFVRVVEGRWRPTGSFRSYLFTVAHRLCLDRLRTQQRRVRLLSLFRFGPSPAPDPEEVVLGGQGDVALQHALSTLSEGHRAVLLLTYTEELTSVEVAQVMGCTDQQVRSKLSYARKLLRQHLEDVHGND